MTEAEDSRNIAHRWPRNLWDGAGKSRWEQWEWKNYMFFPFFSLLFSVMVISKALSENGEKQPWPLFGWLAETPAGLAALALLVFLNGWVLDRSLADRTPFESTLPLWVRCARRLAVTIPLLGIYAVPCRRWVVRSHPGWAFRPSVSTSSWPVLRAGVRRAIVWRSPWALGSIPSGVLRVSPWSLQSSGWSPRRSLRGWQGSPG